jgi:NAD-dependent SIR2 family protein deacetylase
MLLVFFYEEMILSMLRQQENLRIPSDLIPICPNCGKPLTINLRSDNHFVQDKGWDDACRRYENFIRHHKDSNILYLEIGVGYNTPGIIKYNFWNKTVSNPMAHYVCINDGDAAAPREIKRQSICIENDIGKVLEYLQEII